MAESVQALLTFPVTSNAFTALRLPVTDHSEYTGSPPRKALRLDSDTGSTSRKRERDTSAVTKGPVRIEIIGKHVSKPPKDVLQHSEQLRRCIQIILTMPALSTGSLPMTHEAIFAQCQSVVCVSRDGEGLYSKLKLEVQRCVTTLTDLLLEKKGREKMLGYVKDFVEICRWFETQVALLRFLLSYLDYGYVHGNPDLQSIRELCFSQFASIFRNPQITSRILLNIREWIRNERDLSTRDESRMNIALLIKHLVTHGQYQQIFEDPYLAETKEYYTKKSDVFEKTYEDDGPGFLTKVCTCIQEEVDRSKELLFGGSLAVVKKQTQEALYGHKLEWLAKAALPTIMDAKGVESLAVMYNMFAQVHGLKVLCAVFKTYIEISVRNIVVDPLLDDDMVDRLLAFKAFVDSAVARAFVDSNPTGSFSAAGTSAPKPDQDFLYACTDAFTAGFAARPNKPAELLARHLDRALRKGQRDLSDAEFAANLDKVLSLYKFTKDKDVFRTFYQRALSKRLLLDKTGSKDFEKASEDFEQAILKKLKEQYDPEFGTSIQMFTDLALSRDRMEEYNEELIQEGLTPRLSVTVLQRSAWPFAVRNKKIDLPPSMQGELMRYAEFYTKRHKRHNIYWDHALGTVALKARFNAGPKELTVSLYQAVTLLLFNEADELSYKDILEQTHMLIEQENGASEQENGASEMVSDEAELKRTLQSLACGKKRVLKKIPAGKDVNDADVFQFNADFTDPRAKVHINSIQAKEAPEESRRAQLSIEEDRKHFLDAAIVRVMKARKELTNEELKAATIEAVKTHFAPDVKMIKQRIEMLVEQEYIKRDENDQNVFVYVA